MDELRQSIISAGFFDRAIARLSNLGVRTIGRSNRDFWRIRRDLSHELNTDDPAMMTALFDVVDSARLAVNAANRIPGPAGPIPGPAGLPNLDEPRAVGGTTTEVHVIVEMEDPTTGGTARFPLVVSTTVGISRERLNAEAAALASEPEHWQETGRRGEISPETARFVELTIIAVISRT